MTSVVTIQDWKKEVAALFLFSPNSESLAIHRLRFFFAKLSRLTRFVNVAGCLSNSDLTTLLYKTPCTICAKHTTPAGGNPQGSALKSDQPDATRGNDGRGGVYVCVDTPLPSSGADDCHFYSDIVLAAAHDGSFFRFRFNCRR